MFLDNNYKLILKLYISLVTFLSLYYLAGINVLTTYNAMSEWIINYQGGFVRRGLIGELIFQISNFFDINLRFCFLILQSFLYLVFYYLIYDLLKNIKPNYFLILAIFSPVFIIFPIAELEAIGRKEVLIFITLLISIKLYFKYSNNDLVIFFLSIAFPILILTYEASIFYSFFFISLVLITKNRINFFYFFKLIIFSLPSLVCVYAIYFYPHSPQETAIMCEELKKIGEECGLASVFISKKINIHIAEVDWKINHVIRYIGIFIIGYFALVYLYFKSKFNQKKINPFFSKKPFYFHFFILILPSLLMFIIAVDTGRWTHISYTCSFIYFFGLLKHKAIIIDHKLVDFNLFNFKIKNFVYTFLFLAICLSWNPKAVYHEDIGSFPIYRALEKMPNYYNNIFEIKIFQKN